MNDSDDDNNQPSRKRAYAVFEPPGSKDDGKPKRGVHTAMMGQGVDAKHSQMKGPKTMSEVLAQHIGQNQKQRKQISDQIGRVKQGHNKRMDGNDTEFKRSVNLLDSHQKTLGKGGQKGMEGLNKLKGAQEAFTAAKGVRSALAPFFDNADHKQKNTTEEQRKAFADAMKPMFGALKQFGAKDLGKDNGRTKIDPRSGKEIPDNPRADAMRSFVNNLVNDKSFKSIVPTKEQQEASKIKMETTEGKDGKKQYSFSMQSTKPKDPMKGLQSLMNIGNMANKAMNTEAMGVSKGEAKQRQTQMQNMNKQFDKMKGLNMFAHLDKRQPAKVEVKPPEVTKTPDAGKAKSGGSSGE